MKPPPDRDTDRAPPMIPAGVKDAIKKATDCGVGIELSLWCGFGVMRDLYYVEARLGMVTLYLTSRRVHRMVALLGNILSVAKARK